jgi:hypothetical protein
MVRVKQEPALEPATHNRKKVFTIPNQVESVELNL